MTTSFHVGVLRTLCLSAKKKVEKRICYAIIDRIDKMQVGHCNTAGEKKTIRSTGERSKRA